MLRTRLPLFIAFAVLVAAARPAHAQTPELGGCAKRWFATSQDAQNISVTHHTILIKDVHIDCDDIQLFADQAELFTDIDRVRATGNVVFVSNTNRIAADRMEFNTKTKTGTFYVASGIANLENRGVDRSLFGTQEPDAYFWGETIEKLGPKTYRITRGGFTTCVQPTPRWEMTGSSVTMTLEKRAVLTNMVLKVKDVPVFYLPGMYYPINKEDRATGFLIPIYGASSIRGQTLRNAFFWAINRSQDATLYHTFYSKTGQSFGGEYRYIESPGSSGTVDTVVVREHEAAYVQPDGSTNVVQGIDSYTITGNVLQTLPAHLRLTGSANYFSSVVAQQRYQENIYAATNRTRAFGVNVSGNWGANSISGTVDRNETFTNDTDSTVFGSRPRLTYSRGEKSIAGLPIYFGANAEYVSMVRLGNTTTQNTDTGITRFDIFPRLRFPFTKLPYLTFNSSMGFRETYWNESLVNNEQLPQSLQRRYFQFGTTITGPIFTRVFNTPRRTYAQKFKHVIEPSVTLLRTTAIDNFDSIVRNDSTDNVTGKMTSATYGLSNRLYAKKESSREIAAVSISQSYYTDANAAARDQQYQSNPLTAALVPSNFSPIALQAHVSPTSVTDSSIRAEYDARAHALRSLSATGGLAMGWVVENAGWSLTKNIPTDPKDPVTTTSHTLLSTTSVRKPGNGWSGVYSFNYDVKLTSFINQRIIAHYNSQCCGIAIEYQKFNYGPANASSIGLARDHRFNLSFTLAGIGTFSDLFGAFGGQQGR